MKKGTFYEFMIYNKRGELLYYEDLEKYETIKVEEKIESDREFRHKIQNTYGICNSLAALGTELSTKIKEAPRDDYNPACFNDFTTSNYKLSYFKSPTGLTFALLSGKDNNKYSVILAEIYSKIYVEYIVKNPVIAGADSKERPEKSIKCPNFERNLKNYFRKL